MPSYLDARRIFGLSTDITWYDLIDDELLLEIVPKLYNYDISNLDAFVGGLFEKVEADYNDTSTGSSHVGPLFAAILRYVHHA